MNQDLKELVLQKLAAADTPVADSRREREPVHVVYGGAHLFTPETPDKLGRIAVSSLEKYAGNFADFSRALWLKGADSLPSEPSAVRELEFQIADDPAKAAVKHPDAVFEWNVFQKTIDKLKSDPVEDYRIDFEDGYGFRQDDEEDAHGVSASDSLAELWSQRGVRRIPATGFRIKSLQPETRHRALRTFEIFLENLIEKTSGWLPNDFVVALPKIKSPAETEALSTLLDAFEKNAGLKTGSIGIEILVETPESLTHLRQIADACGGRCRSAHFGAYDYTSSFGIAGAHQHLRHKACDFARNMMQNSLSGTGIRLSDSVTTEMPVPIHRSENLSIAEIAENRAVVQKAWRVHFNNINHSLQNGFFQSWDLHPAQLVARYGAVYSYFLENLDDQSIRLNGFLEKATQAMTTGNIFDDMASAEGLLNFFTRGLRCGAFSYKQVKALTGLTKNEIDSGSFVRIMMERFRNGASA